MKLIKRNSDTVISRSEILEKYFREIRSNKPLSREEERLVIIKAKAGDQKAKDKLVEANLRFVINVAKEYQTVNTELQDLIQAGNIGLVEALSGYDTTKDIKFISYAVWWIKNKIIEYLKEYSRIIRLPYNKQEDIKQFNLLKNQKETEAQACLSIEQIIGDSVDFNQSELSYALKAYYPTSSLDEPTGEDDSGCLGDVIQSSDDNNGENVVLSMEDKKKVIGVLLSKLSPIQKRVITLSFGLNDNIPRTNEDIAEELNLTAERVRQIKNKSLLIMKKKDQILEMC